MDEGETLGKDNGLCKNLSLGSLANFSGFRPLEQQKMYPRNFSATVVPLVFLCGNSELQDIPPITIVQGI